MIPLYQIRDVETYPSPISLGISKWSACIRSVMLREHPRLLSGEITFEVF